MNASQEKKSLTLYQVLKSMNVNIDNHYSDLYAPATNEVLKVLDSFGVSYSTFKNNINGEAWVDVPFQYDPYWENKNKH